MQFYSIVYTRTNAGIHGLDFHYKTRPREWDEVWEKCVSHLINEDNFPVMKRPRRIFARTQTHLFWGIALHNQWFLPQEIRDQLEMEKFGNHVRGFWGGLMELGSLNPEEEHEALALIASCLVENETLVNISYEQKTTESLDLGFHLPQKGLHAQQSPTKYPYACRMFQKYIQPDWNNSQKLVYPEDAAKNPGSPVANFDLKGLASLAEKCNLENFIKDKVQFPEENANVTINMIPSGMYNEESFIVQAILSGKPCAVVTGLEKKAHAMRFLIKELPTLITLVDEIQSPCQVEKPKPEESHAEEKGKSKPNKRKHSGRSHKRWYFPFFTHKTDNIKNKGPKCFTWKPVSALDCLLGLFFFGQRFRDRKSDIMDQNDDLPPDPPTTHEDQKKRLKAEFADVDPTKKKKRPWKHDEE